MDAQTLAQRLDRELNVKAFTDESHNGLQVENRGAITRVACGVDASLAFFESAAAQGANFLICHHGLSWGDSLKRITGLNYRRLEFLWRHNMALYACHLPLDAHRRLGNNAGICRVLGLQRLRSFGMYHGRTIGFAGEFPRALTLAALEQRVARRVGPTVRTMPFGPARVRRVAVVSGGAADLVEEAAAAGCDAFVSGEPKLSAYCVAQELGIHALFAGHYDTETFGVSAVGDWVQRRLRIPASFVRHAVPF